MSERIYEMLFIVPADLGEEEQQEALDLVNRTITDRGTLHEMKEWRKRRLAYPINHKNEGIYHLAYFNTSSEGLAHINLRLNQSELILRQSIVRIDEDYKKAQLPLPFTLSKGKDEPVEEKAVEQEVEKEVNEEESDG